MEIIRSTETFRTPACRKYFENRPVGITIGNFDALHLGHSRLFEVLRQKSGSDTLRGVVSFWPHPKRVLGGLSRLEANERPDFYTVLTLRRKLELLEEYGFDFCHIIRFNRSFAALTPDEFVRRFLVETCAPKVVVVGDDWAFGKGRVGNIAAMRELGKKYGFELEAVPGVSTGDTRTSTTAVKDAIRAGDFSRFKDLTGRLYSLKGRVRHGEKRGRELGFPTANLEFKGLVTPHDGIYAAWVEIDGERCASASYIGSRPTFGPGRKVVEVHLIDRSGLDLYGKRIEVRFVRCLREDKRFNSKEELKAAIDADIDTARAALQMKCD